MTAFVLIRGIIIPFITPYLFDYLKKEVALHNYRGKAVPFDMQLVALRGNVW
jgi:hypothetical protein